MTNFGILLRTELQLFWNKLNKISKGKKIKTGIFVLFIAALVVGSLAAQSYVTIEEYHKYGLERIAIDQQLLTLLFLSLILCVSNATMMKEKNTDFLLSLPVKKSTIVFSQTLFKYLFDLVINLIIFLPTMIIYVVKVEPGVLFVVNSMLVLAILPIFFVGLDHFLNYIVNVVAKRFKLFNIIKTVFTILLIFGALGLYYYISFTAVLSETGVPRYSVLSNITDIIVLDNYINLLILLGISLFSCIGGVLLYTTIYGKRVKTYKNKDTRLKNTQQNSLFKTMIKKEFKMYFNTPMYLMNTIIGYIMILAAGIGIFFIDYNKDILTIIAYLFCAFCLSTCSTSNSSLSLEGKNIWIYKSAPIKFNKITIAKSLMNFILVFVVSTVAFTLILISNKLDILTVLLLYVLVLAQGLLVSFGGMVFNLLFPRLDFETEQQVVKQSASVMISLFSFMAVFMVPPIVYFILMFKNINIDINIMILIHTAFSLIVSSLAILFIVKKSDKIIRKL